MWSEYIACTSSGGSAPWASGTFCPPQHPVMGRWRAAKSGPPPHRYAALTAGTSLPSAQLIYTTSDLVESPRTFATTPTLAPKSFSQSLGTVIRPCVQLRKPRIFRFQATCRLLQLTSLTCLSHAIPFPYSLCYRFNSCIMLCLVSHVRAD